MQVSEDDLAYTPAKIFDQYCHKVYEALQENQGASEEYFNCRLQEVKEKFQALERTRSNARRKAEEEERRRLAALDLYRQDLLRVLGEVRSYSWEHDRPK